MCCAIRLQILPPTSAITSRAGHKTHCITSRYVHSADAVLLAAADAVGNATMKLMAEKSDLAPDPAQPRLRNQPRDKSAVSETRSQTLERAERCPASLTSE